MKKKTDENWFFRCDDENLEDEDLEQFLKENSFSSFKKPVKFNRTKARLKSDSGDFSSKRFSGGKKNKRIIRDSEY